MVSKVFFISVFFCPAGGRSVRASCFGNVTVEPAGPSSSLHVFLARAVCSADILLLQHKRPAYFQREAAFPFSYKVRLNQAARHFTFYVTDPLEGVFIYLLPCIVEGAGSVYKT